MPVPYFHVVFTLPAAIADIAYQNKAVIYDALFKASSEALSPSPPIRSISAPDRRHRRPHLGLGHDPSSARPHDRARWRIALDGSKWVICKPGFFVPVRVLSKLFRRLMLEKLEAAHGVGRLTSFGGHAGLRDPKAFAAHLAPLRKTNFGSSTPSRPSPGPKRCSPISPVTPTASPSRTAGWSPLTRTASRFDTTTTAGTGRSDTGP